MTCQNVGVIYSRFPKWKRVLCLSLHFIESMTNATTIWLLQLVFRFQCRLCCCFKKRVFILSDSDMLLGWGRWSYKFLRAAIRICFIVGCYNFCLSALLIFDVVHIRLVDGCSWECQLSQDYYVGALICYVAIGLRNDIFVCWFWYVLAQFTRTSGRVWILLAIPRF